MEEVGQPVHLTEIIKNVYKDTKVVINTGTSKTEELAINQGVRQGCTVSRTLFNIHIEDLIQNWKIEVHQGITHKCLSLIHI